MEKYKRNTLKTLLALAITTLAKKLLLMVILIEIGSRPTDKHLE